MGAGVFLLFQETVLLTLKVPEKLLLYGLYVYYVVHICDFGMLRVNDMYRLLRIRRAISP